MKIDIEDDIPKAQESGKPESEEQNNSLGLIIFLFSTILVSTVCLFVSINVKTAEPIGTNFFGHINLRYIYYAWSKMESVVWKKSIIFKNASIYTKNK